MVAFDRGVRNINDCILKCRYNSKCISSFYNDISKQCGQFDLDAASVIEYPQTDTANTISGKDCEIYALEFAFAPTPATTITATPSIIAAQKLSQHLLICRTPVHLMQSSIKKLIVYDEEVPNIEDCLARCEKNPKCVSTCYNITSEQCGQFGVDVPSVIDVPQDSSYNFVSEKDCPIIQS